MCRTHECLLHLHVLFTSISPTNLWLSCVSVFLPTFHRAKLSHGFLSKASISWGEAFRSRLRNTTAADDANGENLPDTCHRDNWSSRCMWGHLASSHFSQTEIGSKAKGQMQAGFFTPTVLFWVTLAYCISVLMHIHEPGLALLVGMSCH